MPRSERDSNNFNPKYNVWGDSIKKISLSQEEREKKETEELQRQEQLDRMKILTYNHDYSWRRYDYKVILDSWIAYYKDGSNKEKHPKDRIDLGNGLTTFPEHFTNYNCLVELEYVRTVNECELKIQEQRINLLKEKYLQTYGEPFKGAVGKWEKEENDRRAFEYFKQRTKSYGIDKEGGDDNGKPYNS